MLNALKDSLWKQFGASIDMLKNAITLCPDDYWNANKKLFYQAYHCLVFLDYYLTIPPNGFTSPLPFTITPSYKDVPDAIDDVMPDRVYTKQQLLAYLQASREKCRTLIAGLTEEKLKEHFIEEPGTGNMDYPILEILLYNMRHVQHHAAQINLLLRRGISNAAGWVARADG